MVVNQVAGADFLNHFVFVGSMALFSVPRAKQNKALCACVEELLLTATATLVILTCNSAYCMFSDRAC